MTASSKHSIIFTHLLFCLFWFHSHKRMFPISCHGSINNFFDYNIYWCSQFKWAVDRNVNVFIISKQLQQTQTQYTQPFIWHRNVIVSCVTFRTAERKRMSCLKVSSEARSKARACVRRMLDMKRLSLTIQLSGGTCAINQTAKLQINRQILI